MPRASGLGAVLRPCAGPAPARRPAGNPRETGLGVSEPLGRAGAPVSLLRGGPSLSESLRSPPCAGGPEAGGQLRPSPGAQSCIFLSCLHSKLPPRFCQGLWGVFFSTPRAWTTGYRGGWVGHGRIPPKRHGFGDPGASGVRGRQGPSHTRPDPFLGLASQPAPASGSCGAPKLPRFSVTVLFIFLFGKTTKRVAARCLRPRAGAHCAGTERGAAPKETGPPPRQLPAPRRRSLGPIFGPRTTGFASAGQGVEPGASRGSPRHP